MNSKLNLSLQAAGLTEIGRARGHNEDAFLCDVDSGLFIVSDGMGGKRAGEAASQIVVTVLPVLLSQALPIRKRVNTATVKAALRKSLCDLSRDLHETAQQMPEVAGLGATVVAMLIREGRAYIGYAGDSRIYLLRKAKLTQLSEDQTTAAALVKAGHFTPEMAKRNPLRNSLEEYIGKKGELSPKITTRKLKPNDRWLLCSDGLTKGLPRSVLQQHLRAPYSVDELCRKLVDEANQADGSDNITAIVVEVGDE